MLSTTTRAIAAAAITAIGAGSALIATTGSASATPVSTGYTCQYASLGLGPWAVTVDADLPGIEAITQIAAGFDVPAGFITMTNAFTIPDAAHDTLVGYKVEDVTFPNYAGAFGPSRVGIDGVDAKVSEMTNNGDGTWSFQADGTNGAFEVPEAGVQNLLPPATFDLVANVPGIGAVPVPCTLNGEADAVHTITVVKNDSTTTGKLAAKPAPSGKKGKITATVAAANEVPTGQVVAKKGTKTVGTGTLKDGVASIALAKLPAGKNKIVLEYVGDGYTNISQSQTVVVKVTS